MSAADNIEKLVAEFCKSQQSSVTTSEQMDKKVLENALTAYEKSKDSRTVLPEKHTWSIVLKNPITQYAAVAAVLIMATALSITFLSESATPAYAIEQTIQANHSVRYLHIKNFVEKAYVGQMFNMMAEQMLGKGAVQSSQIQHLAKSVVESHQEGPLDPMEFWTEFEPSGQLKQMRFIKPAWMGQNDGKTIIVWQDNKAKLWIEKKNILATVKDKTFADQMRQAVEQVDPKLAVINLQNQHADGNVQLQFDEPADKSEPIVVTATSAEDVVPFQRTVLFVDQATKLVKSAEFYQLRDGEYQKMLTLEYSDYNQPIDPEIFTLKDIPADAMVIDQTAQDVGLAQGDLTDKQVVIEITRQFIEALMKKDFAKAGRLFGGAPAESIERVYGNIKFIRIVSIGETVSKRQGYGGDFVSHKVEIEEGGKVVIWNANPAQVRQVHGQPGRWEIAGGFLGI